MLPNLDGALFSGPAAYESSADEALGGSTRSSDGRTTVRLSRRALIAGVGFNRDRNSLAASSSMTRPRRFDGGVLKVNDMFPTLGFFTGGRFLGLASSTRPRCSRSSTCA